MDRGAFDDGELRKQVIETFGEQRRAELIRRMEGSDAALRAVQQQIVVDAVRTAEACIDKIWER